jgi:hypothetical protein
MPWAVRLEDEFEQEIQSLPLAVREALLAATRLLKDYGPQLGRPHVDTLKGSKFPIMKELRFVAEGGAWRVAFAFDPTRQGILLVAGDKSGVGETRFYRGLIAKGDRRYAAHLARLAAMRSELG